MKPLKLGVAYHGNRLLSRAETDMKDILEHHFNLVVHMFSHNDWNRSPNVMKEIFSMTTDLGLELWVDNWGLNGTPGDTSHFLCYYPDAHQYYSNGDIRPINVCYNHERFVDWTKEWIDKVYECGGRKIFWDEPNLPAKEGEKFSCACPCCKKLFKERYNREMPVIPDKDCFDFQEWTIQNYFKTVTAYASSKGMENIVCVMPHQNIGVSLDNIDILGKLPTMDNIGTDPYWVSSKNPKTGVDVYKKVYEDTRKCLDVCDRYGKDHNIWIQGYAIPAGTEEDMVYAADAAYDAGARTILYWGYRGSEGNDYRAKQPDLAWRTMGDAMARLMERERERRRLEMRKMLGL